jgi:hypothetical protein
MVAPAAREKPHRLNQALLRCEADPEQVTGRSCESR